jgi:hypothetical protein
MSQLILESEIWKILDDLNIAYDLPNTDITLAEHTYTIECL